MIYNIYESIYIYMYIHVTMSMLFVGIFFTTQVFFIYITKSTNFSCIVFGHFIVHHDPLNFLLMAWCQPSERKEHENDKSR